MALQGTLDTFALADVLRLLAATSKTGRLQIDGDRGPGSVWLDAGSVVGGWVDADTHDTSDVVFELLRHTEGAFEFLADETGDEVHEPRDVDDVIKEAEERLAVWRGIEEVVPSLDRLVTLCGELPDDEVILDGERWRTLVAIGEGRSVGAVGELLGMSEIPVSTAVKALVDIGLAEIGDEVDPAAFGELAVGEEAFGEDAFGIVIPEEVDWDAAVVIEAGLEGAGDTLLAELVADGDLPPDLDEVVRAELDADGEIDPESLGGSRDVDLDAHLDAASDDPDHAYLLTDNAEAELGAMPEPLPAGDDLGPVGDPFLHEPAAEADAVLDEATPVAEADHESPFGDTAPAENGAAEDDEPVAVGDDRDITEPVSELPEQVAAMAEASILDDDDAEVARHLSQLSPKAAQAIAAAAGEVAGEQGGKRRAKGAKPEEPMNRNLLMKFISSK